MDRKGFFKTLGAGLAGALLAKTVGATEDIVEDVPIEFPDEPVIPTKDIEFKPDPYRQAYCKDSVYYTECGCNSCEPGVITTTINNTAGMEIRR